MTWRPISEYDKEKCPLVLARHWSPKVAAPVLITWFNDAFYVCPGVPMWYGNYQVGFMTANEVTEFMEIPT